MELTRELAADVDAAFERFVRAHGGDVFSFILRSSGNWQDAEDVTQEAFLRAYRALSRYSPSRIRELRLKPWLFQIAINVLRNRIRDSGRQPSTVVAVPTREPHDRGPTPEDEAERLEIVEEVQTILGRLPEIYRSVILLRYLADLTYEEISEALDRPVGTVKSQAARGLAMLRGHLGVRSADDKEGSPA